MENIFLDCEFNGFGGQLLSMGIVDNNDRMFYEIVHYDTIKYDPWVINNVIPIIGMPPNNARLDPVPLWLFKDKLQQFLSYYTQGFNVVVDWPDDLKYFCESIITGPGLMMPIPKFTALMTRSIGTTGAKPQHNALADAIAIRNNYNKENQNAV